MVDARAPPHWVRDFVNVRLTVDVGTKDGRLFIYSLVFSARAPSNDPNDQGDGTVTLARGVRGAERERERVRSGGVMERNAYVA